jgi:hypothetical protein
MFQLKSFWLKEGVDKVEYVQSDAPAVDLSKDVADFVDG